MGRFGWKAGVPNLGQFSADAYLNEMGITTSSCNGGVANRAFGTENRANRAGTNAVINGCPDDRCRAPTTTSRPRPTTAPAA